MLLTTLFNEFLNQEFLIIFEHDHLNNFKHFTKQQIHLFTTQDQIRKCDASTG